MIRRSDVMLIQPAGGAAVTLYSAPGEIGKLTFVSPGEVQRAHGWRQE